MLHTLPTTPTDQAALDSLGWVGLAFTSRATYLGVLVGAGVTTFDIFAKAHEKFLSRIRTLSSALAHLSIQHKIILYNTYLLPLLLPLQILPHALHQ